MSTTTPERRCGYCARVLPATLPSGRPFRARYCNGTHRVYAWREATSGQRKVRVTVPLNPTDADLDAAVTSLLRQLRGQR